jgi:hypothetical protein
VDSFNINYNVSPILSEKRNCMFFTAKGNVTIAEWSSCAPTPHAVARSSRNTALNIQFMNLSYDALLQTQQAGCTVKMSVQPLSSYGTNKNKFCLIISKIVRFRVILLRIKYF